MLVTELVNLRNQRNLLQKTCSRLEKGGLVAVPTECGYRWLVRSDHSTAVAQLLQNLELSPERPLSVLCATLQQAQLLVDDSSPGVRQLTELYWPGPLALMFKRKSGWKPPALIEGISKIVLRFPQHPLAQELTKLCPFRLFSIGIRDRAGIAVTQPGQLQDCHRWASQIEGDSVEVLGWSEPCLRLESTIVDVSSRPPRIMRSGFVSSRELRSCLGPVLVLSGDAAGPRHFARELSPMHSILVEGESSQRVARRLRTLLDTCGGQRVALVVRLETGEQAFSPPPPELAFYSTYDCEQDGAAMEQSLFEILRQVEQKIRVDQLLIEGPPRSGPGAAILERLHYYAKETINTDLPGYSGQVGQTPPEEA
jgi:L-threonylcarbamoyladenylate synthase